MSDNPNITRITDLPENITMQMGGPMQSPSNYIQQPINTRQPLDAGEQNMTYTQMNVHPNPYGNPNQPVSLPLPQQPHMGNHNSFLQSPLPQNPPIYDQNHGGPQYKLPSRDIPRNTEGYTQDIEITPNYIPAPKLTSDYIRDFQEDEEQEIKTYKQKKHKERLMDTLLTEIQTPIFIAIMFFVFQMPLIDAIVFKRFSFLRIYNEDGNFNFYGLFIKSILFGITYYTLIRSLDYISSI